jgi:hypothetical protein
MTTSPWIFCALKNSAAFFREFLLKKAAQRPVFKKVPPLSAIPGE